MTSCFAWLRYCMPCSSRLYEQELERRYRANALIANTKKLAAGELQYRVSHGVEKPNFSAETAATLTLSEALSYEQLTLFASTYRANMPQEEPLAFISNNYCVAIYPSIYGGNTDMWTCINRITEEDGQQFGWKFHIAIAHDDFEKAWNIIKDKLITHNVWSMKMLNTIVPPSKGDIPATESIGKEVVFYPFAEPEQRSVETWQAIIQEMAIALAQAKIKPGPISEGSRLVRGSYYFSYRNDAAPEGGYMYGLFNSSGADDIYRDMRVTIPSEHQLADELLHKDIIAAERAFAAADRRWCCC